MSITPITVAVVVKILGVIYNILVKMCERVGKYDCHRNYESRNR